MAHGPLAGLLQQRRPVRLNGLLEPGGAALPLPQRRKRVAEVVPRRRPLKRDALAGPLQQRRPERLNGFLDADMTMRAFVLEALKSKGLSVTDEDLKDLRRRGG